jgi:secondary thiamine-phosphate synthase enzyme
MSAILPEFNIFSDEIPVGTRNELDIVNITDEIRHRIRGAGVREGIACLFVAGQTAALTTIEYEPGAVSDLKNAVKRLAPDDLHYEHNARWGDGNGRSHVRAALLGPDLTIPVRGGDLLLGTWQQIVLLELDLRGRKRTVHITVAGTGNTQDLVRFAPDPEVQTANDLLTLTLLEVFQIVGEARIGHDPDMVEEARRIKRPVRKSTGAQEGYWDLIQGAYWVTYTETVRIPESTLLYLEAHPVLTNNGVWHNPRFIKNWDDVSGTLLVVAARGVRIVEGSPLSIGWMFRS